VENFRGFDLLWHAFHSAATAERKDLRKPGVFLLEEAKAKWGDNGRLQGTRSARYLALGWSPGEGADGK